MYVTPSGKMGSCSWGMADLARHERQNTAYPPQTAHSQNPSDSAKCRPPNRLSFLCKILIRQLICPPWALQPRPKTSGALTFLPMLMKADEGHIINTSSVNGFWASVGLRVPHTAYSAAKFAV